MAAIKAESRLGNSDSIRAWSSGSSPLILAADAGIDEDVCLIYSARLRDSSGIESCL